MHGLNHTFGHSTVFASYCDLPVVRPIWGVCQHGWEPDGSQSPELRGHLLNKWRGRAPLLVWSQRAAAIESSLGSHHVRVIPSPWAVLARSQRIPPASQKAFASAQKQSQDKVLCVPFHSHEGDVGLTGLREYLANVSDVEGNGNIQVLMFPADVAVAATRKILDEQSLPWATNGTSRWDPAFLVRAFGRLKTCRKLVTNRITTVALYAASIGVEVSIYGDAMATTNVSESARLLSASNKYRPLFADPIASKSWARSELGFDELDSKRELKVRLGWSGFQGIAGAALQRANASRLGFPSLKSFV